MLAVSGVGQVKLIKYGEIFLDIINNSMGAYGILKWDREYKRVRRRGLKSVIFEFE